MKVLDRVDLYAPFRSLMISDGLVWPLPTAFRLMSTTSVLPFSRGNSVLARWPK